MKLPTLRIPARWRRVSRGQALVEAALILPIVILILLLTIDLGRAFFTQVGLRNAAREAAIFGGYNPRETCASGVSYEGVRYEVSRETQVPYANVGCGSGDVEVVVSGTQATGCFAFSSYTSCPAGTFSPTATYIYRVSLETNFQPVTPFVGLLTGNGLGGAVPMSATTSSPVLANYGS